MLDFTRCRRADGSHYGTAGQCRKGSEDPLEDIIKGIRSGSQEVSQLSAKNRIGKGAYGSVYDVGGGVVIKVGRIAPEEVKAMELLKNVVEVPRLISSEVSSNPNNKSVLAMSKVPGLPLSRVSRAERDETYEKLILPALFKIHSKGVTHNDLHNGNMLLQNRNPNNMSLSIIDFGLATIDKPLHQINDLWKIAHRSSPERRETIESIIDNHVKYNEDGTIQKMSLPKQKQAVKNIWKDLGYG